MALSVGCQIAAPGPTPPPPPPPPQAPTTAQPASSPTLQRPATPAPVGSPSPSSSPSPSPAGPTACTYGPSTRLAQLQERAVAEASALAASWRNLNTYWTLNDSDNDPLLFAFDVAGRALGTFRIEGVRNNDWEALQVGPGANGQPALYVGDIGDNLGRRTDVQVYRTPEPAIDPRPAKPATGTLRPVERFTFVYPDGPHDAETLLVHPTSGEIMIVSKSFSGRGRVYRAPQPLVADRRATLEFVADLDLTSLGLFAGAATDGAYSPDGRRIVLRTYTVGLEYDVPPDPSPAAVWREQPRVFPLNDPPQGEGITYRRDGRALLTIGENVPAVLFQNECQ